MPPYGDGRVFQRGRVFWACYYQNGRERRESLKTTDPDVAQRRLIALRRARERGTHLDTTQRRVRVDELLDDLLVDLESRGAASAGSSRSHMKALRLELGARAVRDLDTASIKRSQRAWTLAGVAAATINRRCELLRQALKLAARVTPRKVLTVPYVPLLPVQNARQGFLSREEADRLVAAIADADVRDFVEWASWSAMRPGEIRQLTWDMVDRDAATLTVAPHVAKTRRGRVLALVGPLDEIIKRRLARRRLGCELVFHRRARGRAGAPIDDFRRAFRAALVKARLPVTVRPYDLRRSALRNLIRSGTHETVAMAISGHRTRSTFDRYNITSVEDVAAAITRAAAPTRKEGAK